MMDVFLVFKSHSTQSTKIGINSAKNIQRPLNTVNMKLRIAAENNDKFGGKLVCS